MTGADGGVGPGAGPGWRWDVALSFAGAQRDYVGQVAAALKARGVRCFYDADEQTELWGKYLADELPAIYGEQVAAVVMFVSAEYAAREWTRLERRAALARAVRERREYVLPARFDDTSLPGLPSDMVTVDLRTRTPQQFAAVIADKLAALAASAASADAGGPARSARSARPAGAVRVSEADPRRLGVHAAISVSGVPDEVLPEYVPRDADAGIRARVTAATERGGFVLLVGGSSVGKTRSAVETVKALLPDWWLVHPAGPGEVTALAAAPPPRTVVWLDELQRYLDGEHGLTGAVVRALLNAPHPAVIISTIWPDQYAAHTAMPPPGDADPHAREREVLDLADVIRIAPAFSEAEQGRARAAAARDPRLQVALESAGYGLTQTLAAAPQLVARWQDAQTASPYAWAVLTAALDAARLGARALLSADFLRAAAPGYCTSAQQAEAPDNWFEQALAYATGKLHGAAAPLVPSGTGMRQIAGYTVADYLLQHADRERRYERLPASTWDAIRDYIRDPADAARLADSARNRLLYGYAIPLYRHAADAGYGGAARELTELLIDRGDLDGAAQILRAWADQAAGAGDTLEQLADRLAKSGDLDKLRAWADAGDGYAASRLADLLAEHGDLDELRARADAGSQAAAVQLARLLAKSGDLDGAAQILRARADAGDGYAARRLADLLAEHGDLDELRAQADTGSQAAAFRLAELLEKRGDLDEAAQILRARADAGDGYAASRLADLLAEHGDLDELRARADAGDKKAADRLARLLAKSGDLDGAAQILRARADAGDGYAASRLADLLAEHGDLDELRARADTGSQAAAFRLAELLEKRGDLDEAAQTLRARADTGNRRASFRLAELLEKRGDLDKAVQILRAPADTGNRLASIRLADLLAKSGDLDGLRARADAGHEDAVGPLARLLAKSGDLDELRARADAGDRDAAWMLAGLLAKRDAPGDAAQILRARADAGDLTASLQLALLLAKRGDLDELRARADAGNLDAASQLPGLLIEQGRGEEAERLRRYGLNPDGSIACA
jgi:TIR domain